MAGKQEAKLASDGTTETSKQPAPLGSERQTITICLGLGVGFYGRNHTSEQVADISTKADFQAYRDMRSGLLQNIKMLENTSFRRSFCGLCRV